MAAAIALPMLQRYREAARREAAAENLRRLGEAMQAYSQRHEPSDRLLEPFLDAD